jgi:hypothetical protein
MFKWNASDNLSASTILSTSIALISKNLKRAFSSSFHSFDAHPAKL